MENESVVFFTLRETRYDVLERKRSIRLGRYRSCSEGEKHDGFDMYYLSTHMMDGRSSLGRITARKGEPGVEMFPISYWTRRYWCIVRECVVIYHWGRMLDTGVHSPGNVV